MAHSITDKKNDGILASFGALISERCAYVFGHKSDLGVLCKQRNGRHLSEGHAVWARIVRVWRTVTS